MKKHLKKILLVLLCVLVCLSASACCKVSYTRVMNKYGQITKTYVIDIDDDYAFADQAYEYLKEKANDYKGFFDITFYEDERKVVLVEAYDSIEEYYVAYGITGDEPNEPMDSTKSGLLEIYVTEDCTFKDLMESKVTSTQTYLDLVKGYEDGFIETIGAENATGNERKNIFEYRYGTSYRNIQSNADDVVLNSEDIYMHTWTVSENGFDGKRIYIRQISPNTTVWYLICIGVSLTVLAVAIYISVRRLKVKKNMDENVIFDSPDEFMAYLASKKQDNKEETEPVEQEKKTEVFDMDNEKEKGDE